MKKVFTILFLGILSVSTMSQLRVWHDGRVIFQCEYALIDSVTFGMPSTPDPNPGGESMTPEETKEHLMDVAKRMLNQFNTADQKEAIDLADGLYVKYRDYSWRVFEDQYDDRFDDFFRHGVSYIRRVARGESSPTDLDQIIIFGFKEESAIFEADEATHSWKYLGSSPDNSFIMRCKDKNGVLCEAKTWGEGNTHTYEYSWDAYHWEVPQVYVEDITIDWYYGYGYYDGQYRDFYKDETGGWYYYNNDERVYVAESDIEHIEGTTDGKYYYWDSEARRWYYNDYDNEHKVSDGKRTIKVVLPDKIYMTLKQGNNEIFRLEVSQEMLKNDHAYFSIFGKLANLSWTSDIRINSTHGSAAFAFIYGGKQFFNIAANLPMYELIGKEDNQSYEDWIEQYEDRYDELFKKIGSADAIVDLFGEVQIKANINNFGYAYRDYMKWDEADNHDNRHTKAMVQQFCSIFNENSTNGIYFNSDVKQAELRVIAAYDEIEEWYNPEPVLFFPSDGTSYGFEQYFNRKPFTDLQYMLEDIINAYIQTSQSLFDEVGTVEF